MEDRMKMLVMIVAACALLTLPLQAALSWNYGWEDGTGTALSTFGTNQVLVNTDELALSGTRSLKMTETPISGTPQAFIWWVTGLEDGDAVVASFNVFDLTPGGNPSGRIWGSYTDGLNIDGYAGSASGNNEYSLGNGWTNLVWTFIFDRSTNPGRTGLVVQARIYSGTDDTAGTNVNGNVIYIDDAAIVVSNDAAIIHRADGQTIPEPVLGLGLLLGLACLRRR
jgi:hypothetical protein